VFPSRCRIPLLQTSVENQEVAFIQFAQRSLWRSRIAIREGFEFRIKMDVLLGNLVPISFGKILGVRNPVDRGLISTTFAASLNQFTGWELRRIG